MQLIQHDSFLRLFSVCESLGIIIIVQGMIESHLTPLLSVLYLGGRAAPKLR